MASPAAISTTWCDSEVRPTMSTVSTSTGAHLVVSDPENVERDEKPIHQVQMAPSFRL